MKVSKIQYIIFSFVLLCSLFVIWLVIKSNNTTTDDNQIESPYRPSLPPVGSNPDETAVIELETGSMLDLGTVPNDKETTRKVRVFNKGKSVLSLKDIRSTCACTIGTIPIGQNTIPPNGEGYFIVTFRPERVAGFHSEKVLTIFSNDFMNPTVELKVVANIEPEFICEPEHIDFGAFNKGTIIEKKVHITQKFFKKPLKIFKVYEMNIPETVENDLSFQIVKVKEEQPVEYNLTIKIGENISPGDFTREIFLSTNIDRFPEVPIRVKGTVTAPYKIEPSFPKPFIVLPPISTETSIAKTIDIAPLSTENKIELVSYEVIPEYFTAHIVSKEDSSEIKINIVPKSYDKELTSVLQLKLRVNNTEYSDHVLLKTVSLTR